jgi:hypothetical protein
MSTETDTLQVEAGPVTDARVAVEVMGWKRGAVPEYSTDIAAAWLVVEKMEGKGWSLSLHRWWTPEDGRFWYAVFEDRETTRCPSDVSVREPTAALAICSGALKAEAAANPAPEMHPSDDR